MGIILRGSTGVPHPANGRPKFTIQQYILQFNNERFRNYFIFGITVRTMHTLQSNTTSKQKTYLSPVFNVTSCQGLPLTREACKYNSKEKARPPSCACGKRVCHYRSTSRQSAPYMSDLIVHQSTVDDIRNQTDPVPYPGQSETLVLKRPRLLRHPDTFHTKR